MNIKQKSVSPALMWLVVAVGIFAVFQLVPARFIFPRNMFTSFLMFPATIYWLYFFIGAVRVHRQAPLSADKIDKLVTEGVYAKVRHPIYSADIILGWSIFFFYPDVRFLVSAHWLMFVLLFWMQREEKALIEKFGSEYLEYMKRVPKMFPKR
jgi:protein-S-isoprenylcysteine O-methyltransferase Ste14